LCQSYHSVICTSVAHVETDECGGPEFFSNGSKLLVAETSSEAARLGKLTPDAVEALVTKRSDIHYPKPKVVSLTQATELGTVYTVEEVRAIAAIAKRRHLKLHMDGARFANAVATLSCHPSDITWRAGVDVLCFGGTKNGLPVGEAVVFFDRALSEDFAYRVKQAGQLASKMRFISAPWLGLPVKLALFLLAVVFLVGPYGPAALRVASVEVYWVATIGLAFSAGVGLYFSSYEKTWVFEPTSITITDFRKKRGKGSDRHERFC
jgi:threonine aldolase